MIWAATTVIGNTVRNSMMAESPMNDYTIKVALYVLMVGFLVSFLLIGGMLILNIGLLSKRPDDQVGGRTPSDVGILKDTAWPQVVTPRTQLPAEEEDAPEAPQ